MKGFLMRLARLWDSAPDVVLWLEHAVLLYLLGVWLMPLLALVGISYLAGVI